jgi:hypothetical protein
VLVIEGRDATEMVVCTACGQVRGRWRALELPDAPAHEQGCRCVPGGAEPWPRFDFNTAIELCHVCGTEPLLSGSRWSPYFCDECKERVKQLNRHHGECIIPIGRHSLMNGVAYDAERAKMGVTAAQFAKELQKMFGRSGGLLTWREQQVHANLADCGFATGADVPLPKYLEACAALPVDKAAAYDGVCGAYGVKPFTVPPRPPPS